MVVTASLLGLAPGGARSQVVAPEHPLEYAIFALDRLAVGSRARITGDLGVNDGEARIGRRSVVAGIVAADVIRLGRRARTEGVTCTLVVGGTEICVPLAGPLVPHSALEVVRVAPGIVDVVVPRRARRVALAPGSYRDARIGRGSSLTLSGGEYDFRTLKLARSATLDCAEACRIRVTRKVQLGPRAALGNPDAADPTLLRIDIEGKRTRTALRIGSRATVTGTLYGPTTDARVGRRVRVTGSIVAGALRAGSRLHVERP